MQEAMWESGGWGRKEGVRGWYSELRINSKVGRTQQTSWSNGNVTSDSVTLLETVAAISLGEEFFSKNLSLVH